MKSILESLILTIFIMILLLGVGSRIFNPRGNYKETSTLERIDDLDELTPSTKRKAEKFLARCEEEGLQVIINETYRSQERQDYLYEQGRSRPGDIVTWTKNSNHTKRTAFDIRKKGLDPYGDEEFFRRCAEIGKEVGLTPGYYFKKYQDKPHFENRW